MCKHCQYYLTFKQCNYYFDKKFKVKEKSEPKNPQLKYSDVTQDIG